MMPAAYMANIVGMNGRFYIKNCIVCEKEFQSEFAYRKYCSPKCYRHKTPEQRFWEKVDIRGPDECWPWKAKRRSRGGYGMFHYGDENYAPRIAWILTNGAIPEGKHPLHKCDNPPCCNPSHLRIGTLKENTQDMIAKGRQNYCQGENVGTSRLSSMQVLEIRRLYETGMVQRDIARQFGVSFQCINHIVLGHTWKWLS